MRVIRVTDCNLTAPFNITDELRNYVMCWIWMCSREESTNKVEPCQGMYDFGLDEERPIDWMIWPEETQTSTGNPIRDFTILQGLDVRGELIINDVGTLDFEQWKITDEGIEQYKATVQFGDTPDRKL